MWAAWVVAAIALAGAGFMLWFLMALLRECAPSGRYWVAPVRRERKKERHLGKLGGIYVRENSRAAETGGGEGDYRLGLVGIENHAKEECASSLVTLDVRPVSEGLGGRSIHSKRGYVFPPHRL
jgi:hypothetical protein